MGTLVGRWADEQLDFAAERRAPRTVRSVVTDHIITLLSRPDRLLAHTVAHPLEAEQDAHEHHERQEQPQNPVIVAGGHRYGWWWAHCGCSRCDQLSITKIRRAYCCRIVFHRVAVGS